MSRFAVIVAFAATASADWTGLLGLEFESDVPVERRGMHCPSGYITGMEVKHGRNHKQDTDFYDFKLKCGGRWGPWSGMPYDESSQFKEEKSVECPLKMHMTGLEVKMGRRTSAIPGVDSDIDMYDFRIQCSGIWQPYLGLTFSNERALASKECPSGTMAAGWRAYRGFVKRGDRDYYEFDLDCRASQDATAAVRRAPNVRELGLSQNVFVWTPKDVGVWLGSLGLEEYAEHFVANNIQGDVIFLLLESHLQDMGMDKIGDRLYFMEVLTQLHDTTNRLAKQVGQLASSRTLPNLRQFGLPLEVVSWSVREVAGFLQAMGLGEWTEAFLTHRIQGDVMFSLTEPTLQEMGVAKIGDRLFLVDSLQSLYEELTAWKQARESSFARGQAQTIRANVPALPGGSGSAGGAQQQYGGQRY